MKNDAEDKVTSDGQKDAGTTGAIQIGHRIGCDCEYCNWTRRKVSQSPTFGAFDHMFSASDDGTGHDERALELSFLNWDSEEDE